MRLQTPPLAHSLSHCRVLTWLFYFSLFVLIRCSRGAVVDASLQHLPEADYTTSHSPSRSHIQLSPPMYTTIHTTQHPFTASGTPDANGSARKIHTKPKLPSQWLK
ncbi:hypothetical protein BDZ45DRAFT_679384 [Acephala macrosclerotiorum]|nr:hypothetical protein BDZ45DRAFT_679384 [Acephala macrosclerotiorum]